jgi:RNA polymerase sigma-70 factor (ECF subfamily)
VAAGTDVHAADLYLASACGAGSADALAIVERTILCEVPKFLARFRRDFAFVDEVTQQLRTKMFVGPSPKILDYSGRGRLHAWIRIAAVRTALNLLPAGNAEPERELDDTEAIGGAELALLKARHRDQFREAVSAAILALPAKQRTLLRMHHLDGFTLDQLAVSQQVHRATVARWLADARAQIVERVRERLTAELALTASEIDSLAADVNSQLELSISRLFGKG